MTALLTDEEIFTLADRFDDRDPTNYFTRRSYYEYGAMQARSIYEARLAEAISLMKEAAPAIDTISFALSERFDRFLAVYAKEDKS